MPIYRIADFPCAVFGEGKKGEEREVRMLFAPELHNGDISFVSVVLRPGCTADVHTHADSDEYMYFEKEGVAYLDGVRYDVAAHSIFQAPKGSAHACGNEGKEDINIICFFSPAIKPYGKFVDLIEKTKEYLKT